MRMQKVTIPEQMPSDNPSDPGIRYVTSAERSADGKMESRRKEVLVRIVIEVDGHPRNMWVNLERGTSGSSHIPLTTYFDIFEAQTMRKLDDGTVSGDYGLSKQLASRAISTAVSLAKIHNVVARPEFSHMGGEEQQYEESGAKEEDAA